MPQRIAAAVSILAFLACLISGAYAENPFGAVVSRALGAMFVTLIVGLIAGTMAQRMMDENLKSEDEKQKNDAVTPPANGR